MKSRTLPADTIGSTVPVDPAFVLSIVANLKDVVFQTDASGNWTYLNRAWTEVTGFPLQESLGTLFLNYVHPDDRERNQALFEPLIAREKEYCRHTVRYLTRTGGFRWVEVYARLTLGADDTIIGTSGTLTDVTERHQAEERLRDSEARKTAILESALDSIIAMDHNGRIVEVNPAAERMFGWDRDAVMGKNLADLIIPPQYRDAHRAGMERFLRTGEQRNLGRRVEAEAMRADGTPFPVELSANVVYVEGNPYFTAYLRDITERKEAEQRLRLSQARLATLITNFQAAVLVEDESRHILLTNQPFCDMFGIPAPPDALVGADCSQSAEQSKHLFAEPEQFVERIATILRTRETVTAEAVCLADGRTLERDYVPIFVDEGYRGHLWLYRDVTARYQLTEELKRSNQALQDFASVASHDLQEPLRKIQAFGGRLKVKAETIPNLPDEYQDYLGRMLNAAGRMQTLIEDLLAFSRVTTRGKPFQRVDLNEIVSGVINDLEARILQNGASVEVATLPTIECDPMQMRQLFQNLLGNALKFHRPDVPPVVRVTASMGSAGQVHIAVTDNGIGFDCRYAERIFDVFERLHGRGEYEGTGIGLAICRRIVERHGGRIAACADPGQGATFHIDLPLCALHGGPPRAEQEMIR